MYSLNTNGQLEIAENPLIEEMRQDEEDEENDEIEDQEQHDHLLELEEECANGGCRPMPPKQLMKVKVLF